MHISSGSQSFSSSRICAFWLQPKSSVSGGSKRQDAYTLRHIQVSLIIS